VACRLRNGEREISRPWFSDELPQRACFGVLGAYARRHRGGDDRLVRVMSADVRDADAPVCWTMSMAWNAVRTTWPLCGVVPRHVVVMTGAMMLPSLVAMLWRYARPWAGQARTRLGLLTALVGVMVLFRVDRVLIGRPFPLGSSGGGLRCSAGRWRAPFVLSRSVWSPDRQARSSSPLKDITLSAAECTGARPYVAGERRQRLATRACASASTQLLCGRGLTAILLASVMDLRAMLS